MLCSPRSSNCNRSLVLETFQPLGNITDLAAPDASSIISSTWRNSNRRPRHSAACLTTRRCMAIGKVASSATLIARCLPSHIFGRTRATSFCQYSSSDRAISAVSARVSRTPGLRLCSNRGRTSCLTRFRAGRRSRLLESSRQFCPISARYAVSCWRAARSRGRITENSEPSTLNCG